MLYALKLSRHCPEGDDCCMQVDPPEDKDGNPYTCDPAIDLDGVNEEKPWRSDMFVVSRAYMEPGTAVGPDDNELLWGRGIYFGPGDFFHLNRESAGV